MSKRIWTRALAATAGVLAVTAAFAARPDGSILYFTSRETLARYRKGAS